MKKSVCIITMLLVALLIQIPASFAITDVSRVTNYIINSDGSFTYQNFVTYSNPDSSPVTVSNSWNVLLSGATVSTSGFDHFTYSSNNPTYSKTYTFANTAAAGTSPVTQYYNIDNYAYDFTLAAGETKTLEVSYSGGAAVWAAKSTNATYPWTNQYGYWEIVGDGYSPDGMGTFTVNITLPTNLDQYVLLGWDVLPTVTGNQLQFVLNNTTQVNEDIVFTTKAPLAAAPEPATMLLLGLGLMGLAGVRRKFKK
jgi:hypothetical protein